MTTCQSVPCGNANAGNPHVRSGERKGAGSKPRCGSPLGKRALLLAFVASLATAATFGQTALYTGTGDTINTSSFDKADTWNNGIAPSAAAAADWDYVLKNGKAIRTPNVHGTSTHTVQAKSFTIGEVGGTAGVISGCNVGTGTLRFLGPLVFANGSWYRASDRLSENALDANVILTAPESAPFVFSSTEPRGKGHYRMLGAWTAEAGTAIEFSSNCSNNNDYAVKFLGDMSAFKAKMTVKARKASIKQYDFTPMHVWVSSPVLAADVHVEREADFGALTTADRVSVAALTLEDGAMLHVPVDSLTGKAGFLRITGAFTAVGKVQVGIDGWPASPTGRLAILSLAAGCSGSLDVSAFTLAPYTEQFGLPKDVSLVVEPDATTGESTLCLVSTPVAQLLNNDSFDNGTGNSNELSSVTNAASWTDGQPVHSGVDYVVGTVKDKMTLRTRLQENDTFPGRSLTLAKNAQLTEMTRNWTVTNLVFYPGATVKEIYSGGSHNWNGERMTTVSEAQSDRIRIVSYFNNCLHFNAELCGNGNLVMSGSGGSYWPCGTFIFTAMNTNFTGTMYLTIDNATSRNTGVSPSFINFSRLEFADKRNLGGPLPAFNAKSLRLDQMSILHPTATVTLDEPTRGVYVGNMARFSVDAANTLTVQSPLAVHGHLYKDGAGRLALGAPLAFGADGLATEPTAGSNLFTVAQGAFQPLTTDCCNGLEIVCSNGVEFVYAVSSDASDFATYGLRNVKAAKPFTLPPNTNLLPITLELPSASDAEAIGYRQALVTVSTDAAASLRGKFTLTRRIRNYAVKFAERDNGDGTVTFLAEIDRKGFVLMLR